MQPAQKRTRRARVKKMNTVLRELYPQAEIALNYSNDWECLVAVVLSAQCTDERVNKTTEHLFSKYPTLADYVAADPREFERDIFQCGFYKNKTRNILAAAQKVQTEFHGALPRSMEEMVTIPGVARKTANVLLSTLYGIHEGIAVDTHVRRFAIRFDLTDHRDPVRIERDLMEIMPRSEWWGFNHRLVHYGRDYCPACLKVRRPPRSTQVYPKANTIWPQAQ